MWTFYKLHSYIISPTFYSSTTKVVVFYKDVIKRKPEVYLQAFLVRPYGLSQLLFTSFLHPMHSHTYYNLDCHSTALSDNNIFFLRRSLPFLCKGNRLFARNQDFLSSLYKYLLHTYSILRNHRRNWLFYIHKYSRYWCNIRSYKDRHYKSWHGRSSRCRKQRRKSKP